MPGNIKDTRGKRPGTLDEVIAHFTESEPKGEIVIVLAGKEN